MSSDFYLKKLVDSMPNVAEGMGASGYFSRPAPGLDPNLFSQYGHLYNDVRQMILRTLYDDFWSTLYTAPRDWSTVWIAGSAASHQFAADRGNGDLDVLIGIDWDQFFDDNPQFQGSIEDAAETLDEQLRSRLWPKTAAVNIKGRTYELTYYVNPLGTHIENIHAYAAYNLTKDRWDIRPPELPEDPRGLFPHADWAAADDDRRVSAALRDGFDRALSAAKAAQPGSPAWSTAVSDLRRTAARATAFFDEIHKGRTVAFSPLGEGFFDRANFRWQAAKLNGIVDELSRIKAFDLQLLTAQHADSGTRAADLAVNRALSDRRRP